MPPTACRPTGTGNVTVASATDIVIGGSIATNGGNVLLDSDTALGGGAIVMAFRLVYRIEQRQYYARRWRI